MKAAQQVDREFAEDDFGLGKNDGELTVSFFPGTTLRSKEVEDIKLGTRVDSDPNARSSIRQVFRP